MNKDKLFLDVESAVTESVPDTDDKTLKKMSLFSKRLSDAIIDYVAIPPPRESAEGFAIVVKNGVYVLEECCSSNTSTIFSTITEVNQTPTAPTSDTSITTLTNNVVQFNYPIEGSTIQAEQGSFNNMNVTQGLSFHSEGEVDSQITSENGTLYNNGDPISSNQFVFSAASEEGLQDVYLKVGSSPYMVNTIRGDVTQFEIAYTLNALLKAPRLLEIILLVEDKEHTLYTMTEDNDPDDFVKSLQRVSLSREDFGLIAIEKGSLVKVRLKQSQYEITDISVTLNIGS